MLIDKDTTTPTVVAGGQATYRIVVRNTGASVASGVTISDTLPTGFTYASTTLVDAYIAPRPTTVNPTAGTTTPTWGNWNIGASGAVTITFVANVDAGAALTTYDNTAYADAANHALIDDVGTVAQDPGTPANQDPEPDEDVTVVAPPKLQMDKDTSTPIRVAGGQATYTIVVQNNGGSAAEDVVVADTLPAGFTYASSNVVATSATRTATSDPTGGDNAPAWGAWDIDAGGQIVITVVANINASTTPGTYDNTANASATNHAPIDDNGTQALDADTLPSDTPATDEDVTVLAPPKLEMDKDTTHVDRGRGRPGAPTPSWCRTTAARPSPV